MKIQSSTASFFPKAMISVLALIGAMVLLFWGFNWIKSAPTHTEVEALPESVLAFLEQPSSLEEVLSYFNEYEIFLGVQDDASNNFPKATREKMKVLGGSKLSKISFRESYAGYFKNGEFVKEKRSGDAAVELVVDGGVLQSASMNHGNFCSLIIGEATYHGEVRGLHVFVKSKYNEEVFQYVFDFFAEKNPQSSGTFDKSRYPNLEQIELVLGESAFKKIAQKRTDALAADLLLTNDEDLVNAELRYQGKAHRVKTRLKGDWTDHLKGDKWSFRIKMRDEETVMGMRKFSLHHPRTRNHAGEWLFHQMLHDQQVLNLQYRFVQFWLTTTENGRVTRKNLGIYALEESFDKLLVERQKRRAGVIIKLDEGIMWEERAEFLKEAPLMPI